MRMLVISDLHANWPALEAVLAAEPHDHLLVVGDLVSYGPHAREVVEYIRQHATLAVRGNHDQALAHQVECRCPRRGSHWPRRPALDTESSSRLTRSHSSGACPPPPPSRWAGRRCSPCTRPRAITSIGTP
jgi:hypothetical protein